MDAEMDMGMDLENVIVIDLNMQAFLFTVLIMLFAEIYLGFKDTIDMRVCVPPFQYEATHFEQTQPSDHSLQRTIWPV